MNRTSMKYRHGYVPPLLTLLALIAGALHAVCQTPPAAQYRIVSYLYTWGPALGELVEGTPGVFYFTARSNPRAVLSITSQGAKSVLTTFPPPAQLPSVLIASANTRYYSPLEPGNLTQNMFSVGSAPGKKLYPAQSILPLLMQNLPDGDMLGAGIGFGGAQFAVTSNPEGAVKPLYHFPSGEKEPRIIYATDGNYYGVSALHDGSGYLYRLTPSGLLTKLLSFPVNSVTNLPTPLLQADDGNLYGATPSGGVNATGTIYKLTLSGQYTLLYTFPKDLNSVPTELIEASDGNLYGATLGSLGLGGHSQLFRITKSGQYTLLYAMTNAGNDGECGCGLTMGSDGLIYGTLGTGGPTGGGGIFTLDVGLPKPSPWAETFTPNAGVVGAKVLIWGRNLFSSSVKFNGVEATAVSSSGSNYLWASVPAGSTTGPITITTPAGTMTTRDSFTVQ